MAGACRYSGSSPRPFSRKDYYIQLIEMANQAGNKVVLLFRAALEGT